MMIETEDKRWRFYRLFAEALIPKIREDPQVVIRGRDKLKQIASLVDKKMPTLAGLPDHELGDLASMVKDGVVDQMEIIEMAVKRVQSSDYVDPISTAHALAMTSATLDYVRTKYGF